MHRSLTAILSVIALIVTITHAQAEPYPAYNDLFVNDLAGVLDPDVSRRLRDQLEALKSDTGVEMTVLTIASRNNFDHSPSIEHFATGLFNNWAIGNAQANTGILVLVAVEDREMRLELGAGYNQGYDVLAQEIMDRWFLPEFRRDDYGAGIEAGVEQTITRIARRNATGQLAEPLPQIQEPWFDRIIPWAFGAIAAGIVGIGLFGRKISDWGYRFRSCPNCGKTGLHSHRIRPDEIGGTGHHMITCQHCKYRDDRPWRPSAPNRKGGGGGSFGGGRSSGGGASGRW